MDIFFGIVFISVVILWCIYSVSGMFCVVGRMKGMCVLVVYLFVFFYVGFGIMGIFSSCGSGLMVVVVKFNIWGSSKR